MKKAVLMLGLILFCPSIQAAELDFSAPESEEEDLFVKDFDLMQTDPKNCSTEGCACSADESCDEKLYCDKESNSCRIGCRSNDSCEMNQMCVNRECVTLCTKPQAVNGELCAGTTPLCYISDGGHSSYCGCSDTSCYDGMKCGIANGLRECLPCEAGERCNCMSGFKPNGAGMCVPCEAGENCGCGNLKANGDGKCVVCNVSEDCPNGFVCANGGTANAKCEAFSCAPNEFADNSVCTACSSVLPHCSACDNAKTCTTCDNGFGAINGICEPCPAATREAKCLLCTGSVCDKCEVGFQISDGKCEPIECKQGTYLNGNDCLPCPEGCLQCSSASVCTACATGYEPVNSQCKKIECEEGAFLRDNFCISCPRNCKKCKDGNSCLRCETGFYFDADENACVLRICKRGTYKDNVSGECRKCSTPHCSACDEESCFGCVMGYTLQGQSCVPEKCPEGCKTCSSPDSCDACDSGYEMVNGECAAVSCPAGKYLKGSSCRKCPPGCAECTDAKTCLSCSSSEYYLSGTFCRRCESALSSCVTCADAKTCLSCKDGKTLSDGWCL